MKVRRTVISILAVLVLIVVVAVPTATYLPKIIQRQEDSRLLEFAEPELAEPVLVHGKAIEGRNATLEMAVYAAVDECAELPLVEDVRPDGHQSLSVLPRLSPGDYATLKAFYHFKELDQYGCQRAKPGERYWDLHAVELKCGPAVLQPQVRNENSTPNTNGILMLLNWPGSEPFPVTIDPPYAQSGVAGFTEGGSIGWGYGGESHIGPDGGPYLVWASSDPVGWEDRIVGADAFDDVGWWDEHCTPNPVFQIKRKEGTPHPSGKYELVDFDKAGNETGVIPFQTGQPPGDTGILWLRVDGDDVAFVPWNLPLK